MKTTGALTFWVSSGPHVPARLRSTTTMSASMLAAEGPLSAAASSAWTAKPRPSSRSSASRFALVTTRSGLAVRDACCATLATAGVWTLFSMAVNHWLNSLN